MSEIDPPPRPDLATPDPTLHWVAATTAPTEDPQPNTSGLGKQSVVPPEVNRWNWGAFLSPALWGLGNRLYLGPAAFVVLLAAVFFVVPERMAEVLFLPLSIVFGMFGSSWAWRGKRWASVEHFKRVQRRWAWAGLAVNIVVIPVMVWLFLPRGGSGLYDNHGVRFSYERGWFVTEDPPSLAEDENILQGPEWRIFVGPAERTGITVAEVALDAPIAREEFEADWQTFARAVAGGLETQGAEVIGEPVRQRLGLLPGIRLQSHVSLPDGEEMRVEMHVGVSGSRAYSVYCQIAEDDEELAVVIHSGCEKVVRTFRLTAG